MLNGLMLWREFQNRKYISDFDIHRIATVNIQKNKYLKIFNPIWECYYTVILWIFADDTKLLPMLVFKGISGGRTKK